jgi:hypothetical protein
MPFTYDSKKKATELTVKYQHYENQIPLPLLVILFKNLARKIADIFNISKNIQSFKNVISDIALSKIKITETSPAFNEITFLLNLKDSDAQTLRECSSGYEDELSDNDINNYSKTFSQLVFLHLFDVIAQINQANAPKGNDLRRLQMWHLVDKSEIQSLNSQSVYRMKKKI